MRLIKVNQKQFSDLESSKLKATKPDIAHVAQIINEEAIIISGGRVIAIYKRASCDLLELKQVCNRLKFERTTRKSGITSYTISLNASPRSPRLDNRCWTSRLRRKYPLVHEIFMDAARMLSKEYLKYFKKQFVRQAKETYLGARKVLSPYRIYKTPFTSGVINKNSALPYHFDLANTTDGISCMLILKSNVMGGELILPQLDIGFACQDNYILLFDGKSYLHGVTAINKPLNRKGYRYTIVFYNNSGMFICMPPEEEELHYQQHLEKQAERRNTKNHNDEK